MPIMLFYATESEPRTLLAYDTKEHRVLWEMSSPSDYTIFGVMPPDQFVLGTNQFGMSVSVYEAQTGRVIRSFAPFVISVGC